MAEAMSGFAAINGEPDGPPLLPPIALTDEVDRDRGRVRGDGRAARARPHRARARSIDVNLLESMLQMMSALPSAAAHLGYEQPRLGSGIPYSVPRGTYRCADDRWVAISTSAESVAHRVLDAARPRRRPALRDVREPRRAPRGARRARSPRGSARARRPRCWPRSKRPRPRSRPCTRCARCWPIRTCGRATCSSRSTASSCRARSRASRARPAEMRWAGRALGADTEAVARRARRPLSRRSARAARTPGVTRSDRRPHAAVRSRGTVARIRSKIRCDGVVRGVVRGRRVVGWGFGGAGGR